ncbi:MAG: hypothetical protein ABFS24_13030 [Pseudomonadota bacterium]
MNNKGLLAIAASACLAMLSQGAVAAKGFNYTYVDGGYSGTRADSFDADGFNASLSFGATDHIIILAGYSHLWQDEAEGFSSVDVDIDEFKIGGGGHYSIGDRFDLVGSLVYVNVQSSGEARFPGDSTKSRVKGTKEGYELEVSGRILAMDKLELEPLVVYRDVGSDSDTGFGLDAIYNFHKKWSVRGNATYFSDDSETNLFLGVRLDM